MHLLGINWVGLTAQNGRKLLLSLGFVLAVLAGRAALRWLMRVLLRGEGAPARQLRFWAHQGINLASAVLIALGLIETPAYIQAGREDHIAPPDSVFRMLEHLAGPTRFVLAGSGHIAGVVNPPDAKKYQYWTSDHPASSLAEFQQHAVEHPGSWWADWLAWLREQAPGTVAATGKRVPGGEGDSVIEDAPGRYVMAR